MRLNLPNPLRCDSCAAALGWLALAFWPTWAWYLNRVTDGSDEPWGLLALITAIGFLVRQPVPAPARWQINGVLVILGLYVATFPYTLPLIRAAMAVSAISLVLGRARIPIAPLLLLSLPVVPTLQFFMGYPLRLLAAKSAATLLHLIGFAVTQEGTALGWRGETVLVDAPCSGLKMVWAAGYLAATLACHRRLGTARTLFLMSVTGVIIVGANIVRSTILFFKEAHIVSAPEWTHPALGLAVFAVAAVAVLRLSSQLKPNTP